MTPLEDRYFDLKGLAQYSSLSVRTLRDYLYDTDDPLPFFRIKNKILIRKSEFDTWIEKHRSDLSRVDTIVDEILNDLAEA